MQKSSILIRAVLILYALLISDTSKAGHIVGGDVTYEFVSFNQNNTQVTFKVIFNMYRDEVNSQIGYDEDAVFAAYQQQADGSWEFYDSFVANPQNIATIEVVDDPCVEESAQVGVESAFYETFFTLDIVDQDYMIAFQRCCRNKTSTNILNDNVGSVFDVIITSEAQRLGNNSPVFLEYPPIFICSNFPIRENISATDSEGDQLRYSLCAPLQSGGTMGNQNDPCLFPMPTVEGCLPPFSEVDFTAPFSATAPMGGRPTITLSDNGILSGIPEILGQYVVGICVEEFRNGVLLSTLRRDFQFNVVPCQRAISASLTADSIGVVDGKVTSFLNACGDNNVNFASSGLGATVENFEWLILSPDGSIFFEGANADLGELDLSFPDLGDYSGYVAVDDGSQCQDTAFFVVSRKRGTDTAFEVVQDSCFLGPVGFQNMSEAEPGTNITDIFWNINGEFESSDDDFEYEFADRGPKSISLISTNNLGCSDTLVTEINYNPPHDETGVASIDTTLCFGDSILFDSQWITVAGQYEDILQFRETGCDSIGRSLSLSIAPEETFTFLDTTICVGESVEYFGVSYNQTGEFRHSTLSITTGCDSIIHDLILAVEEFPFVEFSESSVIVPSFEDFALPVEISGEIDNISWEPTIGLSCSDCPNPTINSDLDTTYIVIASTSAGCSTSQSIDINFVFVPEKYYFPNILIQDGVSSEDTNLYLQTNVAALRSVDYDLQVIDRWGNLVFNGQGLSINDKNQGWSSRDFLPGVYIYNFTIREFFETKTEVGSITLIK